MNSVSNTYLDPCIHFVSPPLAIASSTRSLLDHGYPHGIFLEHFRSSSSTIMSHFHKGLRNILQKHPNDVVFLSALRTPITRSYKGGLRNAYPEQMLATVGPLPAQPSMLPYTPSLGPPCNTCPKSQCPTLRRPRCRSGDRPLRAWWVQSRSYGPEPCRVSV